MTRILSGEIRWADLNPTEKSFDRATKRTPPSQLRTLGSKVYEIRNGY